jgi:hypothetical protein
MLAQFAGDGRAVTQTDVAGTYKSLRHVGSALNQYCSQGTRRVRIEHLNDQQLHSRRADYAKAGRSSEAAQAAFELLQRAITAAGTNPAPKQHQQVLITLVWLIRSAARGSRQQTGRRMVADLYEGPDVPPQVVQNYIRAGGSLNPSAVRAMTGLTVEEWHEVAGKTRAVTTLVNTPAADRISVSDASPLDLDVASRLARMASAEHTTEIGSLPTYDRSDAKLRLTHVSVTGFRGSPGTVALDLTKNGKPVNVLLWGDNGVGKSTLVDGMEFALQSRVDRSSDFTSSLRPKVRNLYAPEGVAAVTLSDGSTLERSLVVNDAGRDVASDLGVRPGFRIAPVVIRRADILRFLDTDALSRGTVFFDYFPDAGGGLGVRPDEELKVLDEERSILLVVRADLASQLSAQYPEETRDLTNAQQLDSFVSKLLTGLAPLSGEEAMEQLPTETRRLIHELRTTQHRLQAIKKKLAKGLERNNPVAYKAQLSRVVPALHSVGEELTASFKDITRATHVESLDVLVAKSGPVSLDVVVRFDNGTSALPQQAFSEGYKDLVALLLFLAITKKAGELGQAKVLILDDALQSVDASVRVGVMDYVLERFKDWQLIVTGHDRGWLAQLRALFNRRGRPVVERTISRWSFENGIEVSGAARLRVDTVQAGLEQHDERMTAAAVGILLEEICQELSWRLESSVHRRQGDRYTLGDLWPGIAKLLRPLGLGNAVDGINQRLEIRNLLGGHFNDFADSISWSDIQLLAEDVLTVYDVVHCDICGEWIAKNGKEYKCRCPERNFPSAP